MTRRHLFAITAALLIALSGAAVALTATNPFKNVGSETAVDLEVQDLMEFLNTLQDVANDEGLDEHERALRVVELTSRKQVVQLGLQWTDEVESPGHTLPSTAIWALSDTLGGKIGDEQEIALAEMDALPTDLRDALTGVINAFHALDLAAKNAYRDADLGLLQTLEAQEVDAVHGATLESAGVKLAEIFAARLGLVEASLVLKHVLDENDAEVPQLAIPMTTATQQMVDPGEQQEIGDYVICINAPIVGDGEEGETIRYEKDCTLLVDTSEADKEYHNNAGGRNYSISNSGASALIDFWGNNGYGDPNDPRNGGVNGGARVFEEGAGNSVVTGNLLSMGDQGNRKFVAGDQGVNGGASIGNAVFRNGFGFLLVAGGNNEYFAEGDDGTNGAVGGGTGQKTGLLLDLNGNDYYEDSIAGGLLELCLKDPLVGDACDSENENSCWDCSVLGKGGQTGFQIDLSLPEDIVGIIEETDMAMIDWHGGGQFGLRGQVLAEQFTLEVMEGDFDQYEACFRITGQPEGIEQSASLQIGEDKGLESGCMSAPAEAWMTLGDALGVYEVVGFVRPAGVGLNVTGEEGPWSETFTATAVELDTLHIQFAGESCPSPPCGLVQVGETAGEVLEFVAVGVDDEQNFIPQVNVTWTVEGVGELVDNPENEPWRTVYRSNESGAGMLIARWDAFGNSVSASVQVDVDPGPLAIVRVWDNPDMEGEAIEGFTIISQDTANLHAFGFDEYGNLIDDPELVSEVVWGLDNHDLGTLDVVGTTVSFTADASGDGKIRGTYEGEAVAEIDVEVRFGDFDHLVIRTDSGGNGAKIEDLGSVTAGDIRALYAAGYDEIGNFIMDFNLGNTVGFEWVVVPDGLGSFNDALDEFTFETAGGGGEIKATFSGKEANVQIDRVHPGSPAQLGAIPPASHPIAGEPFSVDVRIEDTFGNLNDTAFEVGDTTVNLRLEDGSSDLTGTLEQELGEGGVSVFQNLEYTTAETITLYANATLETDGGVLELEGTFDIVIKPNSLDFMLIRNGFNDGGAVSTSEDPFIAVAGIGLDLFAAGYDKFGNYIEDTPVSWSVDGVVTNVPPSGSFEFLSEQTGQAEVNAIHMDVADVTAFIEIVPAELDHVLILDAPSGQGTEVERLESLTAGTEIPLYVAEHDKHGNWIQDANVEWDVDPKNRGFFNRGGDRFTPGKIGEGAITPLHPVLEITSIPIEITDFGPPGEFVFLTESENYIAGDIWNPIEVRVEDGFENHVADDDNTIITLRLGGGYAGALEGNLVQIASNGHVTYDGIEYTVSDEIWIVAEADTQGDGKMDIRASHGPYRISPAPLDFIVVRDAPGNNGSPVDAIEHKAGEPTSLFAAGYDRFENYREEVPVEWNTTIPGLGTFDPPEGPTTTFTPAQATTGGILAEHSDGPFYTIAIDTRPGPLDHILVRNAPDDGGDVIETLTIHSGNTTELYAAGYDAFENFISDVDAWWRLDPLRLGSLKPTDEVRNTTFIASEGGTGRIVVNHDKLHGDLEIPIRITTDTMPPQAVIDADCVAFKCIFDATASLPGTANIEEYRWDLGDGNTERGQTFEHTYREPGNYEVVLNVTDTDGRTHETRQSVSISPPPEAQVLMEVTTRPTEPRPGEAITATARIENVGSVALLQFSVTFTLDDALVREQTYPRLEAGEMMNISASWSARPGNQTLHVQIPDHAMVSRNLQIAHPDPFEIGPFVEESPGPATLIIVIGLFLAVLVLGLRSRNRPEDSPLTPSGLGPSCAVLLQKPLLDPRQRSTKAHQEEQQTSYPHRPTFPQSRRPPKNRPGASRQ